jgi:hypothetical protein
MKQMEINQFRQKHTYLNFLTTPTTRKILNIDGQNLSLNANILSLSRLETDLILSVISSSLNY